MSDRARVLWDMIGDLGGPDVLAELMEMYPELWLSTPAKPDVAMPWSDGVSAWGKMRCRAMTGEYLGRVYEDDGGWRVDTWLPSRESPEPLFATEREAKAFVDERIAAFGLVLL